MSIFPGYQIFFAKMAMTTNKIRIILNLKGKHKDVIPMVRITINDTLITHRHLDQFNVPLLIDMTVMPGKHTLSIELNDHEALKQDPKIAIEVTSLKFQNLPNEFSIYSCYQPIYPEHWITENLAQGRMLEPVIHSNYIGWCGRWWIDFETPIYTWLHKKLNLGWLL